MNYYNEHDPFAAAWLKNLIAAGHIPKGDVDDRDIQSVTGADLEPYGQCHFFAGIGGWPLALELAGWHGPVWTGSCPCQPFSAAGQRRGTDDERHLWPEFHRLIAERNPPVVFGEQVASKDGRLWLTGVRADLEALGYAVGAADLCAAGAGAPHIRQRLWWVADAQHAERRSIHVDRHDGRDGQDSGRQEAYRQPRARGEICGLAEPEIEQSYRAGNTRRRWREPANGSGLGDANRARLEERSSQRSDDGAQRAAFERAGGDAERLADAMQPGRPEWWPFAGHGSTAWSGGEFLPCLDGKARRVEPSVFPLAHGVPARVGRLRGFGNAIVPQVAAEFIGAYLDR